MTDSLPTDLVSLLDECWKQIDPTDITSGYDVEVIANASVLLARAAHRLAELEHEHDAILRGRRPTHRCKLCGALWIDWGDSWSLFSRHCGQCCDNVAMGDQIEPLPNAEPRGAEAFEIKSLLQEAVTLAELGDIDESTEAHGWGAWLKQARNALAGFDPCRCFGPMRAPSCPVHGNFECASVKAMRGDYDGVTDDGPEDREPIAEGDARYYQPKQCVCFGMPGCQICGGTGELPTPAEGNGETVGRAIAETTRTSDEPAGVRGYDSETGVGVPE